MWSDDPRFYTRDAFLDVLAGIAVLAVIAGLLYGIRKLQAAWAKEPRKSKRTPLIAILATIILALVAIVFWWHSRTHGGW